MFLDIYYLFIVVVFSIIMPFLAIKSSQELMAILTAKPQQKSGFYLQGVVIQWLLCAAILIGMYAKNDSWQQIGLTSDSVALWLLFILIMVVGSMLVFHRHQLSDTLRCWVLSLYHHVKHYLPVNKKDNHWGVLLSVTAGVCEEIAYRGFLFWQFSHSLAIWPSVLLVNIIFALVHYGTGFKNALASFFLGMLFSMLYLWTGDLWLAIVCHVLIDLVGITVYPMAIRNRQQ